MMNSKLHTAATDKTKARREIAETVKYAVANKLTQGSVVTSFGDCLKFTVEYRSGKYAYITWYTVKGGKLGETTSADWATSDAMAYLGYTRQQREFASAFNRRHF